MFEGRGGASPQSPDERPTPPPAERFVPAPTLTAPEVAFRAAIDLDLAKRVWRALGMPDVQDEDVAFDERDVEALIALNGIMGTGIPVDEILTMTRLYGTFLARVADAETRLFQQYVLNRVGDTSGDADDRLRAVVDVLLQLSARLLDQTHRRHLALALDSLQARQAEGTSEPTAVGFVDLVDFSRISDDLPGEALTGLVDTFERVAVEACADAGARLVKVIGDAVMFVSPQPREALDAAMTLIGRTAEKGVLPDARGGLDFGDAVTMGGDYFGRPVNVAARITAFARPATVVVSGEFVRELGDGVEASRIGRRELKGVGRVELFKVRAEGLV